MQFKVFSFPVFRQRQKHEAQQAAVSKSQSPYWVRRKKIFLTMKLTVILLIATCLQVSAVGYSQYVTLSERNAPLKKVFTEISKQTGYSFFCNESLFEKAGTVTVKVKNATLQSALDICLKDQSLAYSIVGNNVVIKEKEKEKVPTPVINADTPPVLVNIFGRVVNENGEPLVSASVKIKGSDVGVATDANGNFSINADLNTTLVISYVGYVSIEVVAKKQDLGKFTLKLADNINDEVVVVGYGKVQRKNLTGSISSVKASDVVKSPETSLNSALQGRAAGVSVVSSEGGPSANVSITIRAGSSISAQNDPLYVINGFPQLGGSNLNLNVNDIETIDILKDGASAAYGSRGANGVVLITTKSGKAGKFSLNYDAAITSQNIATKIPLMNAGQYAEIQHALRKGSLFGDTSLFRNYQKYRDSASINWMDRILRNPMGQTHNLTFSGGTENVRVLASLGYFHQPGVVIGTQYDRYTANINTVAKINKVISNETVLYLAQGNKNGAAVSGETGPIFSAVKGAPFIGSGFKTLSDFLTSNLGNLVGTHGVDPVIELNDPKLGTQSFSVDFNTAFTFRINENLNVKVSGGISKSNDEYRGFYPSSTSAGTRSEGQAGFSIDNGLSWLNENTINYSKRINDVHNLDVTLGTSMQKYTVEGYSFGANRFLIQSLGYDNLSFGSNPTRPSSYKSQNQLQSYFGIVRYSFKDRYLFSTILRADGSSKFPKNQWGYFPYVSFGWKINEEKFFQSVHDISTLKLRLSYGQTGNESVPAYSSLSRYSSIPSNSDAAGGLVTAQAPLNFGVGDLRWETNIQTNLGLDLGLFKDRVLLTVDAYKKKSKNLLLQDELTFVSGYRNAYRNVGDIEVKGLEINLNTQNVKSNKFSWSTNFNIAFTRGKVLKLNGTIDQFQIGGANQAFLVKVGQKLGNMYGYVVDGIYNSDEEYYNSPKDNALVVGVGSRKYKDISGPDGKPDGIVDENDRAVIGNGNPKYFGGINNELKFGPIDASFLITYSYGNDIMNLYEYYYNRPSNWQGGPEYAYLNHWTNQNPQVNEQAWASGYDNEYSYLSSYQIQDGSYLRLKNVMLGYNLPVQNFKKIGFTKLRFYISATNLLTLTKYRGYDPEVNYYNSVVQPGVDYGSYPRSKFFTFGINASF
ncbi:MAG: TonB-dependent receptor [Ginsengibacter sp.]